MTRQVVHVLECLGCHGQMVEERSGCRHALSRSELFADGFGHRAAFGSTNLGNGRLSAAGDSVRSSVMSDSQMIQRAYTAILQYFVDTGRAPHYVELADVLDIEVNAARKLVHETATTASPVGGSWMSHDTDNIESWAPFSNVPTHYLITVGGVQKWFGQ